MLNKKKLAIALGLIPQILIIKIVAQYPDFIENYYSEGLYPIISKMFRFTLGWLPFSFGDMVYGLSGFYIIYWFIKNRKRVRHDFKNWCIDVGVAVSVIYFAFHLFWALNYYRLPLHKNLNLSPKYTTEKLIDITENLVNISNKLHASIVPNDTIKVTLPHDRNTIFKLIPNGYDKLQSTFPALNYNPKSTKHSLFSFPLSYMGFSGYLNPLTNEAQVNYMIPLHKFPTTTAHEIAHQLGYAAENEANFIGFMAASINDDPYIKYAGYIFGLRFCLNELHNRDKCAFEDILADVNKGILKNYEESRLFWKHHENPLEPIFKVIYGNFLKANNQSKGMESYNYVVALLVNYLEKHKPKIALD